MTAPFENDDLQHGHIVIVAARWLLALAGLGFLLYHAGSVAELAAGIAGVLVVAVVNFHLHTRILTRRPVPDDWIYWASAGDLLVVSLLVILQGGLASKAFVFFYPAVLCFALVFPRNITWMLAATLLAAYTLICASLGPIEDERILIPRLLALAGVAYVGSRYRDVEVARRSRRATLDRLENLTHKEVLS